MGKRAPAWLVGTTYLPFGLYNGFVAIALPLLLTARGMPLDRALGLEFLILLPSFLSFLITPLVDCGMQRRTWAMLCAGISAVGIGGGVLLLDGAAQGKTGWFVALMLVGYLAAQMYCSTMGGMTPNLVAEEDTGSVSAWLNMANLGGTGLGGWLGIVVVQGMPVRGGALALAAILFAPCLLLLVIGAEVRVPRAVGEMMRRLFADMGKVSRTRSAVIGLLIFVTPSATFAAQNSFSGLGRDFGASDNAVTWITGAGSAMICSLGAAAGGWLANRMDRRVMFVGSGVTAAVATVSMAFGGRTAMVFFAGTAVYYLLAGINYAAASAVAFDIMGVGNPVAATQYAMLMAACNVAIETVIKGDQWGYARHGARGLLLADAAFSVVTGAAMLAVIRVWGGSGRETRLSVGAVEGKARG